MRPARRAARSSWTPTPRAGSPRSRTATTVRALVDLLPGVEDDLLRAGIWDNLRSGYHHGCARPGAECSTWPSRACRSRTPRTPSGAPCPGCWDRSFPLAGPDASAPGPRGSGRQGRPRPGRDRVASSRRSAPSCPPTTDADALDDLGGAAPTFPTASPWTSTCGGGSWCAWPPSAPSTWRGSMPSSPLEPTGRRTCAAMPRPMRRCRRRGEVVGLVLLHRRDRGRQLRAHRRRHRPVAWRSART